MLAALGTMLLLLFTTDTTLILFCSSVWGSAATGHVNTMAVGIAGTESPGDIRLQYHQVLRLRLSPCAVFFCGVIG